MPYHPIVLLLLLPFGLPDAAKAQECVDYADGNPPFLSTIEAWSFANHADLREEDDVVFLAASYQGLITADVSDPANPQILDTFTHQTGQSIWNVSVADTLAALVVSGGQVLLVDAGDPAHLEYLSTIDLEVATIHATIHQDQLIISTYFSLEFYSIADPASPVFRYSLETPMDPNMTEVHGEYLYIANGLFGVQVVELSNTPAIVHEVPLEGFARCLRVHNGHIYIAAHDWFHVLELTVPALPQFLTSLAMDTSVQGLAIVDNTLYAAGFHYLYVYNITDPADPILFGQSLPLFYGENCNGSNVIACERYVGLTESICGMRLVPVQCPLLALEISPVGNDVVLTWDGVQPGAWDVYALASPFEQPSPERALARVTVPYLIHRQALSQGKAFYVVRQVDPGD